VVTSSACCCGLPTQMSGAAVTPLPASMAREA
jgi:hypothetical protein